MQMQQNDMLICLATKDEDVTWTITNTTDLPSAGTTLPGTQQPAKKTREAHFEEDGPDANIVCLDAWWPEKDKKSNRTWPMCDLKVLCAHVQAQPCIAVLLASGCSSALPALT